MNKIKNFINPKIIICCTLILVVLLFLLTGFKNNKPEIIEEVSNLEEVKEDIKEVKKIKVEIKGAVNSPGVYEIDENSRVIDVINISGGFTEDANIDLINLSKKLEDEMVIIIYTNYEIMTYKESKVKTEYVYIEVDSCPDKVNNACIKEYTNESNSEINGLINLNIASLEELTSLTGVGESKAKAIIEYRNNSKFKSIEEIKNISGIGESLFEKIKENITV